MSQRVVLPLAACVFVAGVFQFFAGLGGPGLAAFAGITAALLCWVLIRFFEVETGNPWLAVAPPVLGCGIGVLLLTLGAKPDPLYWFAPVLAGLQMALIIWWLQRDTRRCSLCESRVAGLITFVCPRCHLVICENCWNHGKLRCRLCVQNAVPLFPDSKQWWDRNIGLTTKQGRCQICQADTEQAELRACRKCGRPQCLECWDDANGVCAKCHARPGELPAELEQLMPQESARK
jgi:hypothetical protein